MERHLIRFENAVRLHNIQKTCTVIMANGTSVSEVNGGAVGSKIISDNPQEIVNSFTNLPELNELQLRRLILCPTILCLPQMVTSWNTVIFTQGC